MVEPFISPVCIVAVYAGRKKPNNFNEFLQLFVDEMTLIQQNGVEISTGVSCRVTIHSFVCDAPARADVKRTKHVNYCWGCDKCTVEGIYNNRKADDLQQHQVSKALQCGFWSSVTYLRVQSGRLHTERSTSWHGASIPNRLHAFDTSWAGLKDGKRLARWLTTFKGLSFSCSTCNHKCTAGSCHQSCSINASWISASVSYDPGMRFVESNRSKTGPFVPRSSDTEGCAWQKDVQTL